MQDLTVQNDKLRGASLYMWSSLIKTFPGFHGNFANKKATQYAIVPQTVQTEPLSIPEILGPALKFMYLPPESEQRRNILSADLQTLADLKIFKRQCY